MNRLFRSGYSFALGLTLVLLVYDGAIRKWLLPEAEQLAFILKDMLLALTLAVWALRWAGRPRPATMPPPIRLLVVVYAWWVILEMFNPNLPNVLVGIWGVKSHLLYASLLFLLPAAYSRLEDLFRVLAKLYPWLVIPVCTLAFAQLLSPTDSILNEQVAGSSAALAYFGESGLVRVSGPFSYISGMAAFVQISVLLGLALYLGGARSRLFLVSLGFALASLPVTGSRAVVAVAAVGAILVLGGALTARLIGTALVVRALAVMAVLGAISLYAQDAAWEALAQRTMSSRQDENRLITAFTNAFEFFDDAGLTGFGSGAANLGSAALSGNVVPYSWLPNSTGFEEESGRIVLELGIVGWAISLSMRIGLLCWAAFLVTRGRSREARLAGVIALPLMALGVQQGNGVFAVPLANAYYWFCVAMMAMGRHRERQLKDERTRALREQQELLMTR
jgi:hypothetical protein